MPARKMCRDENVSPGSHADGMRPRLLARAPSSKDTVRGEILVHCQLTTKLQNTAIPATTRPGAMRLAFVNMLETLTILVGTPNRELVLGELVDTLG
jgi:hypothetical protein